MQDLQAHATSVEDPVGDIAPMPPPLSRLSAGEQRRSRNSGGGGSTTSTRVVIPENMDSTRSVASSTRTAPAGSPTFGTGTLGGALVAKMGSGALALRPEEQWEGEERTWGGGRESDASALSMAEEAALFWEVRKGEFWEGGRILARGGVGERGGGGCWGRYEKVGRRRKGGRVFGDDVMAANTTMVFMMSCAGGGAGGREEVVLHVENVKRG